MFFPSFLILFLPCILPSPVLWPPSASLGSNPIQFYDQIQSNPTIQSHPTIHSNPTLQYDPSIHQPKDDTVPDHFAASNPTLIHSNPNPYPDPVREDPYPDPYPNIALTGSYHEPQTTGPQVLYYSLQIRTRSLV